MRVLAIDTTSENGSLALLEDDRMVAEQTLQAPDGFAQVLFPAIEALLRQYDWKLDEIDIFAAASGPGAFTGVRVGLAGVKGLAEATGRTAQAVSNLRALAGQGTGPWRMPLINARRGEVYWGLFDEELNATQEERIGPLDSLAPTLTPGIQLICRETWAELTASGFSVSVDPRPLAGIVARLALRDGGLDPAALDANYVRRSDADGRWRDG